MGYNSFHFDQKLNALVSDNTNMVSKSESIVLECLKSFLLSCNGHQQTQNFDVFIQLIIKIRFNVESAGFLLPQLADDYRFKTSVNLLYRASLDDIINIYYLLGYVVVNNDSQVSLGNELDIMHRDFLKSAIKIIEGEIECEKYHCELQNIEYIPDSRQDGWKKKLIEANIHLYDQDKENWKGNKDIRSSSLSIFKDLFPTGNSFISESAKIEFIERKKFRRHFMLTLLFKYFSQYQHFSPKMHQFLLTSAEKDLDFYHKMLLEILCVVSECNEILNTNDRKKNKMMISKSIEDILVLHNDFYDSVPVPD